jgi:DNA topoisomerase-3
VETKVEQVKPPRLFDLTSLQREANKRHGLSAARTLAAAQRLYETHKYLTYPRTDSQYITSDMASGVANLVRVVQQSIPELGGAAQTVLSALDTKRIVNDAKVTDHHAIIPTDGVHDLSKLSSDEMKIYDLVARRFLAALLNPQVLERTVVWVKVPTPAKVEWFRAAGRREISPGWRAAWPETKKKGDGEDEDSGEDGDDSALCEMRNGESTNVQNATVVDKLTKAPARFNEASLLAAMETAGKFVDDEAAAEAMKERGLGTPATRAAILETLLDRTYIVREGRALVATDKGRGLIVALGEHPLTRPDLTGEWEQRLRGLERLNGAQVGAGRRDFGVDVAKFTREVVAGFEKRTPADLQKGRRTFGPCPQPGCGGEVVLTKIAWGCTSWKSIEDTGCGFVYWREQNGKKATEKQLHDFIGEVRSGKVVVGAKRERIVLGKCPRCGEDVLERAKGWGCSSWKSKTETGCGYVIWKTDPGGGVVDSGRALEMLQNNTTNQREKVVLCPCPRCKGSIVERPKFYGCDSWKSPRQQGCGILVWKLDKGVAKTIEAVLTEIAAQGEEPAPAKKSGRKSKK